MEKKDFIRLHYELSYNPKVKDRCYIFYNGRGGEISDKKILNIPLSKLDIIVLQRRPQIAKLPIGHYKLIRDFAQNSLGSVDHFIDYERVDEDPKKK
jgi:hypothetical protein